MQNQAEDRLLDDDKYEKLVKEVCIKSGKNSHDNQTNRARGSMLGYVLDHKKGSDDQNAKALPTGWQLEFENIDEIEQAYPQKKEDFDQMWMTDSVDFAEPALFKKNSIANFDSIPEIVYLCQKSHLLPIGQPSLPFNSGPPRSHPLVLKLLTPTLRYGIPAHLRRLIYPALLCPSSITPSDQKDTLTSLSTKITPEKVKFLDSEIFRTFSSRGPQLTEAGLTSAEVKQLEDCVRVVLRAACGKGLEYVQGLTSVALGVAWVMWQANNALQQLQQHAGGLGFGDSFQAVKNTPLETTVFELFWGIVDNYGHGALLAEGFSGVTDLMADIMNFLRYCDSDLFELLEERKMAYFMEMIITIGFHGAPIGAYGAIMDLYAMTGSKGLVALICGLLSTFKLDLKKVKDINELGVFVKTKLTEELTQNSLASIIPPDELTALYESSL